MIGLPARSLGKNPGIWTVTIPVLQAPVNVNRAVSLSTQLAVDTAIDPCPGPPRDKLKGSRSSTNCRIGSEKFTRISVGPLLNVLPSAGVVLVTKGGIVSGGVVMVS